MAWCCQALSHNLNQYWPSYMMSSRASVILLSVALHYIIIASIYQTTVIILGINWPNSQIPQCTCPISHNAPFGTEMCTFLFWMLYCGIWDRRIEGFVRLVYYHEIFICHIWPCFKSKMGHGIDLSLMQQLQRHQLQWDVCLILSTPHKTYRTRAPATKPGSSWEKVYIRSSHSPFKSQLYGNSIDRVVLCQGVWYCDHMTSKSCRKS